MLVLFLKFISIMCANIGFRGCRFLGYCFGIFAFDILSIRKKILMHNLDIAFGKTLSHKQKKNLGRMSYINIITTFFETMGSYKLFPKAHVEFENKEIFDNAYSKGQGIYEIIIHMGNFELLCYIHKSYEQYVAVKNLFKNNEKANNYIKQRRKQNGFNLVEHSSNFTRTQQIFNAIENKKAIGFVVDQKLSKGEMIPFFGKPASTNNSLAKLYFRKKAPIIPLMITRIKPGFFKVKNFNEFIYEKNPKLSLKENITAFTTQMNQMVEKMILECPQEYLWGHNRWNYKKNH